MLAGPAKPAVRLGQLSLWSPFMSARSHLHSPSLMVSCRVRLSRPCTSNLVWHGFLAKNELPRRQTALLLLLLVHAAEALSVLRAIRAPDLSSAVERQGTLTQSTASTTSSSASPPDRTQVPPPRQLPPPHQPPPLDHGSPCFVPSAVRALWRPRDADAELLSAAQLLAGLCAFPPPPLSGGCRIILNAPWIRPGHVGSLCRALAAYACADYATFACLCTPILEAAVRCSFVWANPSERALEVARLDTYFATLDGYGQRAKHQLMLDTTLHSNGQPNRLAIVLGRGLHALLVDLFLHAAGPALRAKYAHAEAEMVAGEMGDEGTARAARVATSGERPTVDALHNTETEPPARTAAAVATATHSIDGPPPVAIQMLYAGLMALCVVSHGEGRLERLSRKHTRGCEAEVSQPVLGDGGEAARTGRAEMADGIGCAETADGRESMFAREDERMACARVATRQLIDRYYSQCHPLARLQRLRTRVGAALAAALGVGPLYQVEAQQAGVEDDGSKNGSNESIGDEMVDVTTPLTGGSTQTLSVACTLRPADATAAARVAALRDEAAHVACAGLAHGCDNADANCASIAGDGEATGEADGYAGSGDGGGADAEAAVECSRMGVLSSCERFLLLDERRLRELTERVERRTASTAQRRSFIYLCQATMAHRQLAAVLVSLVDQHPLVTPHSCCSPADANPLVPLAKLHVAAEALCAAFESGKTERVIAQGEALLKLARHKRRAIMNEHVC